MSVELATLRRLARPVVVPVLLFVATLAVRVPRLGAPRHLAFDEVFYVSDALDLLTVGVESGRPDHPPLGKWLIASGIEIVGFTPSGWRAAALVAGAALVVVTYLVALALTGSRALGALAGVLVMVDGLSFTMGRVAMLDGFLTLFLTMAGGLAVVAVHRRRVTRGAVIAAGVALGCAISVKWSAVPPAGLVLVLFLAADSRVRRGGWRPRLAVAGVLIALPATIYMAVHIPWLVNIDDAAVAAEVCEDPEDCSPAVVTRIDAWIDQQLDVLEFHRELRPTSWQAEPAWTWITSPTPPVILRKICLPGMTAVPDHAYDGVCPRQAQETTEVRIAGVANPVLWAGAGVAGLVLLWRIARERDRVALSLVLLALSVWAPWLVTAREAFSFYAVALVPILAWWIVVGLAHRPEQARWATPVVGLAAVAAFAWFYPVLVGIPLDPGDPRFTYPFWI